MRNVKLILQYEGAGYAGWQLQNNAATVQGTLEAALATILQEKTRVSGAGRTDAGVHALGQVAAFKTTSGIELERLSRSLNGILPPDIRVKSVCEVAEDFVPRFAREKTYRYAFTCEKSLSPFQRRYAWSVGERLDFDAMRAAAAMLVGEHDFSSFTAAGGGKTEHTRKVHGIEFGPGGIVDACDGEGDVHYFDIAANGFLYKMVRNIVGTLVEIGRGKIAPEEIPEIIAAKDRSLAGPTAPAHGLCLVSIRYDGTAE